MTDKLKILPTPALAAKKIKAMADAICKTVLEQQPESSEIVLQGLTLAMTSYIKAINELVGVPIDDIIDNVPYAIRLNLMQMKS